MMTEEEARGKWCPASRYSAHDEPSSNRWKQSLPLDEPHATNPVPCRCIASACMWWRWVQGEPDPTDDDPFRAETRRLPPSLGYCGAAGPPTFRL
jgi:hypothetical protein